MLQLTDIAKSYGGTYVFAGVSLHVGPGDRLALIGPNGCGKTTLLRLVTGALEADGGSLVFAHGTTVGYLPQEIEHHTGGTLFEEMLHVFRDVHELEAELRSLEAAMEERDGDAEALRELLERYSVVRDQYEHADPATQRARIGRVLSGLGFLEADHDKSVSLFSGGWQMRIALARLLLQYPALLLLDEPTNHLDIPSLEWLEEFLGEHRGSLIVVSHDRYFLDRLCTKVAELERGALTLYHGNYTSYVRQKEERLVLQEKQYDEQQRYLEKSREFMERFRYKATKAKAVHAREKLLGRLDLVEAPQARRKTIHFRFREGPSSRQDVLSFKNLTKSWPGKRIGFEGEVQLTRGDRVAVVGPNGIGKSTLFKMLAGLERPDTGRLLVDAEALIGYYSQMQSEDLDADATPLEELEGAVELAVTREEVRRRLGCFLLTGDAVFKPIRHLSGGEKARVALARLTLQPVNLLLLDEPTNHLDIPSRDVLAEALQHFEGTVLLISHDRYFLDQVVTKVLALDGTTAVLHLGTYTDYAARRRRGGPAPARREPPIKSPPARGP